MLLTGITEPPEEFIDTFVCFLLSKNYYPAPRGICSLIIRFVMGLFPV
jgi:hypothetical protein